MQFCNECGEMMRYAGDKSGDIVLVYECTECDNTHRCSQFNKATAVVEEQQPDVGRGISEGEYDDLGVDSTVQVETEVDQKHQR